MTAPKLTPLAAVNGGAVAGAAGTLAMDLIWYRRHRRTGGESGFDQWEFSTSFESYEEAPAPAKVGNDSSKVFFRPSSPQRLSGLLNNTVRGTAHGFVAGSIRAPELVSGPATGATAWAAAYTVLGSADLYKPIWEYDAKVL